MIVVIPAYEPDCKMLGVIRDFHEKAPSFPLVIVDDGSSEPCQKLFAEAEADPGVTVLHHEKNRGKGAALKTAFAYIAEHYPKDEGILTVDADGQHLIHDALRVVEAWEKNPDMLVTGGRQFKGAVPLRSRLGNGITRGVFHLTTGKRLYDTQTGLRAFSVGRVPEMLALHGDRYEYEIHQLLYCCTASTGVYEVPIETVYLENNQSSHFDTLRDSAKIYKVIFKFLKPMFLRFITSSLMSFVIDFLVFCLAFYGTIVLFAGWDTAASMFSFSREVGNWDSSLTALHPYIFYGDGSLLRDISLVIARICSSLFNFTLNKSFVFQMRSSKHGHLWKYAIVVVMVLCLNAVFIELLTMTGLPAWACYILAQLICYPLSFALQRVFVFKKGKDSVNG